MVSVVSLTNKNQCFSFGIKISVSKLMCLYCSPMEDLNISGHQVVEENPQVPRGPQDPLLQEVLRPRGPLDGARCWPRGPQWALGGGYQSRSSLTRRRCQEPRATSPKKINILI